jgi:hypothetical protein
LPKRNAPKRGPPIATPGTLPAPILPTPHLSSTIFRKASSLATEEGDSEKFTNYLWLFRTRMPVLRRQDLLCRTVFLLGGKVGNLEIRTGTSDQE